MAVLPGIWLMKQVFALLALLLCCGPAATAPAPPLLILLSIDGFRADYLRRGLTPTLAMLAKTGVQAQGMRPSFPSLTFPNHYTLVTGLRPDHHGVVDNEMWDQDIGETFTMSARTAGDSRWWEGGKPLWVTAAEAGRTTASAGWPGDTVAIFGRRPTYLDPWRDNRPADEAVTMALHWLDLPARYRPSLTFLYFYEVDARGHEFGPDSPELNAALARVDAAVAKLVNGLKARGLADKVNLVITADHGMAATPADQFTVIDDLVPPALGTVRTATSLAGIDPLPGHDGDVARILLAPHPHFTCWRKSGLPGEFHYGGNARVPQFLCLNERGWRFRTRDDVAQNRNRNRGNHGYDPGDPQMAALFIGHGPDFARGVTLAAFDNVDVYPLLARITGLKPGPNDGNLADVAAALKH
jgi:predicted AlkP superfamily pyrophosphatase or phosphodiesterase